MFPLAFLGCSHEIRFLRRFLYSNNNNKYNQFVVYKIVYGSLAFRSFAFKRYLILDRLLFI